MAFTRKTASLVPIKDTVFAVADMAKKDKAEHGEDAVTDATIGSLYGEDGKLVAFDTVFDHYDAIDHRTKAAYASSFTGNPDYRKEVWDWVTQGSSLNMPHSVIATPGGTGAVSTSMATFLDAGQTVILPDIAWGSYSLMAAQDNLKTVKYQMFEGDHFNLASVKNAIEEVHKTQDRIVLVVNSPCHNPTGYSLSDEEWKELTDLLNEAGKTGPVILVNDIAYIDYSYNLAHSRAYMDCFNQFSDQVMGVICFSCSKTLTSYGLRCGAAVIVAKQKSDVRDAEIVFEKNARATWSNIPNAAMKNFVWVVTEKRDTFLKEKQKYIDLMKERSSVFLKEAEECGLETYPYKEGFFVTIKVEDNDRAERIHAELMKNHIYTVLVNKGIRVACCSLPVKKAHGLAARMKTIADSVH